MNEQKSKRLTRHERAEQRAKRVRGLWEKPSLSSRQRVRWILAVLVSPLVVWAMVSVLAAGKFPREFTFAHLVILVAALVALGFFVWDTADASRAKTWRTSWRSSRFRLACMRLFARDEPIRCPYCHDSVEGDAVECPGCEARFHAACRIELGGCSTLGCVESNSAQPGTRHKKRADLIA